MMYSAQMTIQRGLFSALVATGFLSMANAAEMPPHLTPVGAERAGNAEGTIPPWTGGIVEPVEGWQPGGRLVDPFSDEGMRLQITGENLAEHEGRLSAGQMALFERYDGYRMDVYPTHRTCALPNEVYERTENNLGLSRLDAETGDLVDGIGGIPFPMPTVGAEVMWNHKLAYFGEAVRYHTATLVTYQGQYVPFIREEVIRSVFHDSSLTSHAALEGLSLKYFNEQKSPSFLAGEIELVHETLNGARRAWSYNPGQRRVRRAPSIAYDNPVGGADGAITQDQWFMFNGRLDRYDWKLIGKQELYVPYNNYVLDDASLTYEMIVDDKFPNRDLVRYELHRVWKVEATLKSGFRHIMPKRVFYVDEDSWRILVAEGYDQRGELWRVQEATTVNAYQLPSCVRGTEVFFDLNADIFVVDGVNVDLAPADYEANRGGDLDRGFFTPARLRTIGKR